MSRGFWVATPVGHRSVWQRWAWMQPMESIASRPTLTRSHPRAMAAARSRAGRACRADEHRAVGDAALGEGAVDAGEAPAERQRHVVGEDERRGAGAALAAVDGDEVGAAAGGGHARLRSSQKACSPTADLMPTGSPVASAMRSMNSSMPSTSWKAVCPAGLLQSTPTGMPRMAAISGVTLAPGSMPPRPGLAPWLSLISMARTGAVVDGVDQPVEVERCRPRRGSRSSRCRSATRGRRRCGGGARCRPRRCCAARRRGRTPLLSASMALPLSEPKLMAEMFTTDDGPERLGPAGGHRRAPWRTATDGTGRGASARRAGRPPGT